jgi:hypothetical protein
MPPLPVVKDLDKGKQIVPGFGPGEITTVMDTLGLELAEEALHRGIVIAAARAAHADLHGV